MTEKIDIAGLMMLPEMVEEGGKMKPIMKASIAYVAGCLITKKAFSSVLDQAHGTDIKMSGTFTHDSIDVHEHESGSKLLGMTDGQNVTFFHSGENVSVSLQISGTAFKGKDGAATRCFNGSVQEKTVKLYDYTDGKHYNFTLN